MKPSGLQLITEFIYCSHDCLNDKIAMEQILEEGIKACGLTLKKIVSHQFDPIGITSIAIIGESHIAIHTYPEAQHASIDIFTCSSASRGALKLLNYLKERLVPKIVKSVEISRGNPLSVSDGNWIASTSTSSIESRYHVKNRLLNKKTKYQQIDIIENDSFGRMLFLDKDLQIAESDAHLYNSSLITPIIKEKAELGAIAILGGGDGGVLHELLKHNPKSVTLVDIDSEVIELSKEHLPNICYDAFSDPRVTVEITDANKFLDDYNYFDAIIYDLTMHPEAFIKTNRDTYLNELFSKISNRLNKGGLTTMQCCSEFDTETYDLIQKTLPKYFNSVDFKKCFIPSFCENWVFAKAIL